MGLMVMMLACRSAQDNDLAVLFSSLARLAQAALYPDPPLPPSLPAQARGSPRPCAARCSAL